ncbi:patatin-like phospholipase family protein [Persicitalea sp.]|uniref:patatin-like phospholipase family protein n=1 Tax=Persicitalea sp. TaxID=3100273 RepID=UPI003593FEDF
MRSLHTTFFLCSLLCSQATAQPPPIKNLVFEGAGIRGIAYAGVLSAMEEQGALATVERVGGTSAGAISSLLFALGYTPTEIEAIISQTKFQKFNDGRFFFIGSIARTKKRFGWYRGQKFSRWLGDLVEAKTGSAETTFAEMSERGFRELYVTATCLNKQEMVVLSRQTYPDMKIRDAVRISMSIPLYFQAVFVDSVGRTFSRQNRANDLDVIVDGGIIGNFPIQLFDSVVVNAQHQAVRIPNVETIGIRIDSDSQIKEDTLTRHLAPFEIANFRDYLSAFYVLVIESLNRPDLTDADWSRTISVSSAGITPKVKRLSAEQKASLVNSGRESTRDYLQQRSRPLTQTR